MIISAMRLVRSFLKRKRKTLIVYKALGLIFMAFGTYSVQAQNPCPESIMHMDSIKLTGGDELILGDDSGTFQNKSFWSVPEETVMSTAEMGQELNYIIPPPPPPCDPGGGGGG